jgi:hypothetical protein
MPSTPDSFTSFLNYLVTARTINVVGGQPLRAGSLGGFIDSTLAASKTGCPNCSAHRSASAPGLGPAHVAALKDQLQALQQENLNLRRSVENREKELAAAREANRRLMTELTTVEATS